MYYTGVIGSQHPQPGFNFPHQQSSLVNHFRMQQGRCSAFRRKWRLTDTDLCPCGETQIMSHIVESCPLTKLNGSLFTLHSANEGTASNPGRRIMVHDTHMRKRRWKCNCFCVVSARRNNVWKVPKSQSAKLCSSIRSSLMCGPQEEFQLNGKKALSSHCTRAKGRSLSAVATGRFIFCLYLEKYLHIFF